MQMFDIKQTIHFSAMYSAELTSQSSECLRGQTGCVICTAIEHSKGISRMTQYVVGVNAPPPDKPTCKERGECLTGERHGRVGCRNCLHAEIWAIVNASTVGMQLHGTTCYTVLKPCLDCAVALACAGVKDVYFLRTNEGIPNELADIVSNLNLIQMDEAEYKVWKKFNCDGASQPIE